jgi:hypothetical protein
MTASDGPSGPDIRELVVAAAAGSVRPSSRETAPSLGLDILIGCRQR